MKKLWEHKKTLCNQPFRPHQYSLRLNMPVSCSSSSLYNLSSFCVCRYVKCYSQTATMSTSFSSFSFLIPFSNKLIVPYVLHVKDNVSFLQTWLCLNVTSSDLLQFFSYYLFYSLACIRVTSCSSSWPSSLLYNLLAKNKDKIDKEKQKLHYT